MSLTARLDSAILSQQMRAMTEKLGIAAPQIVKVEARALVQTLVKITPPNSLAQGRNAVARDINNAVTVPKPGDFKNERINELIGKKDRATLQHIFDHSRERRSWKVADFTPVLHTSVRDRRGHVRNSKRVLTLDARPHKQYVKEVQKRVGSAKGSWKGALDKVGGRLPAWAARNAGLGSKHLQVIDNLSSAHDPNITVTNSAPGVINRKGITALLERAVRIRSEAMRRKTERMLADPVKHSNLFNQYK